MRAMVASLLLTGSVLVSAQAPATVSNQDRELGIKLIQSGRSSEALNALKKATSRSKLDAEAWYYLGVVYVQLKDFKKAGVAFETAVKIRPEFAEAYTGFSYALLRRGKLGEAKKQAEKALAIQPKSPDAHYTLGVISFREGARDQALKHADLAIEQNPRFAEAYLLKSQALVAFSGGVIFLKTEETKEDHDVRYRAAVDSLEKYLHLTSDSEDKQVWKDQIESLRFYLARTPGEKGPDVYPGSAVTTKARLLSKPEPAYTEEARQGQVVGTVVLRVVFASDGTVKHILVLVALPGGLTEQSVRAARRIKFIPATLDGKPVSMFMQLEYNFNLY
jgi:predicted Zn-dependent protease